MDRKEIKERAKSFAFQNKWNIWKPFLILIGISFGVELILALLGYGPKLVEVAIDDNGLTFYRMETSSAYDFITSLVGIASIPLSFGVVYYIMNLIRGNKMDIKEIFSKYKYFLPLFILSLLIGLFTFLWSLLLIIPGIIFAFKMAMAGFIAADELDENTKPKDVMNKSKEMMDGHKWEYFVFNLSFIGWYLLIGITFGIAAIWVVPYVQTANIMYYDKLKELKNV